MTDIAMPQLSDAMEDDTIVKWLVEDGGDIVAGVELVGVETNKATMVHPAEADGTLQIVVPEGDSARVGELIARISDAAARDDASPTSSAAPTTPTNDTATTAAVAETDADVAVVAGRAPRDADASTGRAVGGASAVATPVAGRYAHVHDIDLDRLAGSGPRGQIVKGDVLRAAGIAVQAVSRPQAADAASATKHPDTSTPSARKPPARTSASAGNAAPPPS